MQSDAVDAAFRRRYPRTWALWKMSRPSQLLLILVVYALGVAIALGLGTNLRHRHVALGAFALVPTAMAVHYANEYADYETDALTTRTPFSGGSGALSVTGLPRRITGWATVAALLITVVATFFAALGGLSPVAIGTLFTIAVLGLGYSLPPLSLSRRGLGELDNALLGGLLLPHYGAATLGRLDLAVCLAVVPFTLLVFVNLLETQWPDRRADARVGKDTLAVRWSAGRLRVTYWLVTAAAFASLLALWGTVLPAAVVGATLLAVPLFLWGAVRFTRRETPFPAVVGMVVVAVAQLLAWTYVAGLHRIV